MYMARAVFETEPNGSAPPEPVDGLACRREPHDAGMNLVQQVLIAASPLALRSEAAFVPVDHECPAEPPRMLHNPAAALHRFLSVEAHTVGIEERRVHDRQRQFQKALCAGKAKHLRRPCQTEKR